MFLGGPGRGPGPWEPLGGPRGLRNREKLEVATNSHSAIYSTSNAISPLRHNCIFPTRALSVHVLYNNSIKYLFQKFRISFNFILHSFQSISIKAISVQHALHAHN